MMTIQHKQNDCSWQCIYIYICSDVVYDRDTCCVLKVRATWLLWLRKSIFRDVRFFMWTSLIKMKFTHLWFLTDMDQDLVLNSPGQVKLVASSVPIAFMCVYGIVHAHFSELQMTAWQKKPLFLPGLRDYSPYLALLTGQPLHALLTDALLYFHCWKGYFLLYSAWFLGVLWTWQYQAVYQFHCSLCR